MGVGAGWDLVTLESMTLGDIRGVMVGAEEAEGEDVEVKKLEEEDVEVKKLEEEDVEVKKLEEEDVELKKIRVKQIYRVPFERNTERVKQLRYDYVQRVMELEADAMGHELLFVDEAGFNLSKTRRRGRNIIGHRAIINVPGQRGGNITIIRMKQIYRVERNTERVKQLRYDYVQRVMELEADAMGHELLFVDEAGFNLSKTRRRGRNIIGHRAIINVPGQRGGNITMCAAISLNGVVHHHATIGPYNTAHIIAFLDTLHDMLTVQRPEQTRYVIIWDNVSFHRAALVRNWFTDHPFFTALNLPPYSPFLNPIEEFFSAWRWKVYDRHPHQQVALLQAMEEACGDIDQASCQAWIRHSRRYFPRCLGLEDIACDVDEILWPDPERRHDVG
ncbi:uncharacterized protein LOC123983470 [Micropterus dolomieu]|uniref:uncharacterized protein LOC123983470 n=1 Tax=Micropterus dolomieu TaxID=147949 RepID=UPI001E8D0413|nr:uncharacterized protein LOC123983470 [Micropterus dolomieu]